jgi:DNA-binding beta-propeller fold protein YncE
MALDIDAKHGKLATVSYNTPEAAIIDLKSGAVKVIELPRAKVASGVAFDAQDNLLFVVSQDTDNLLIVNAETGETLHDVEVGATPLNVTFEPKSRLAYIANRSAGTIAVVNTKGEIVANLETGGFPNQLRADGKGNVWAVNKSRGENDEAGDRIWRITAKAE